MACLLATQIPLWLTLVDDRLERLLGEVGPDAVVLPLITEPRTTFRREPPNGQPHTFVDTGGWTYPSAPRSVGGVFSPRTAAWVGRRNLLTPTLSLLRERQTHIIFEFAPRRAPTVAANAATCFQDVFGDVRPAASAFDAAYRALLIELASEWRGFEPSGVIFRDWRPTLAPPKSLQRTLPPDACDVLSIDFSPAARQIAALHNVDVEAAARTALACVTAALQPDGDAAAHVDTQLLKSYTDVLVRDWGVWLDEHAGRLPGSLHILADGEDESPNATATTPSRWLALTPFADVNASAAGATVLSLTTILTDGPDELVRRTRLLVERGATAVIFTDFALAPSAFLDPLRQAVRYARRG